MKVSNSRLSIIQACETIKRLPHLPVKGQRVSERFIMFSLDDYDIKVGMSAIYSDPNFIARSKPKPKIKHLSDLKFAYTGLTDLELSNIVRNKDWFELTTFCRTSENEGFEVLTKTQVAEEYGIKYLGEKLSN